MKIIIHYNLLTSEVELFKNFCVWQNINYDIVNSTKPLEVSKGRANVCAEIGDEFCWSFHQLYQYFSEKGLFLC